MEVDKNNYLFCRDCGNVATVQAEYVDTEESYVDPIELSVDQMREDRSNYLTA